MTKTKISASILLATYEMPRHLELVLTALERQSTKDFEIIICDDGSSEATGALISRFTKQAPVWVKHLWQPHEGFRKSRILNQGLRESQGKTLIFLDGDCVPHCRFVEDHIAEQEEGYYLAGRRVELGKKFSSDLTPKKIYKGILDGLTWPLIRARWKKEVERLHRSIRVPWRPVRTFLKMNLVDDLKGCNFSLARRDMELINGFDEEYEGHGREDTEVEIRLQNLGLKIKSIKGLAIQFHVWHPPRDFTPANDNRLDDLKRSKRIRCQLGWMQDERLA